VGVDSELSLHVLNQLEPIADHLKQIHRSEPIPLFGACSRWRFPTILRRNLAIRSCRSPPTTVLYVCTHHAYSNPSGGRVQIVHRRQADRSPRQPLERAQCLDRFDACTDSVEGSATVLV